MTPTPPPVPEWAVREGYMLWRSCWLREQSDSQSARNIALALVAAHDRGVEAVAVASASCPLPKPYYRGELAAKIRACKAAP